MAERVSVERLASDQHRLARYFFRLAGKLDPDFTAGESTEVAFEKSFYEGDDEVRRIFIASRHEVEDSESGELIDTITYELQIKRSSKTPGPPLGVQDKAQRHFNLLRSKIIKGYRANGMNDDEFNDALEEDLEEIRQEQYLCDTSTLILVESNKEPELTYMFDRQYMLDGKVFDLNEDPSGEQSKELSDYFRKRVEQLEADWRRDQIVKLLGYFATPRPVKPTES